MNPPLLGGDLGVGNLMRKIIPYNPRWCNRHAYLASGRLVLKYNFGKYVSHNYSAWAYHCVFLTVLPQPSLTV